MYVLPHFLWDSLCQSSMYSSDYSHKLYTATMTSLVAATPGLAILTADRLTGKRVGISLIKACNTPKVKVKQ